MSIIKYVSALVICLGCVGQIRLPKSTYVTYADRGYVLGTVDTASVGDVIMEWEVGEYIKATGYRANGTRCQLINSGVGDKIFVSYRELARRNDAYYVREAFGQSLSYDLGDSSIVFQDVQIRILGVIKGGGLVFSVVTEPTVVLEYSRATER